MCEYAQIEGAIAAVRNLPMFIMAERGVADRGITWTGTGHSIHYIPADASDWIEQESFMQRLDIWLEKVYLRSDIFFGYSSKAKSTATSIHLFLKERLGLRVRNWEIDFATAGIIIDEIEPVILWRQRQGKVLIILEEGAKMPADLYI